ncbi:MAG: hypothetical protein LIP00_07905, partial [Parabacteroides sp.]|nr:hypothetical protein [Parabacteroides sp.]
LMFLNFFCMNRKKHKHVFFENPLFFPKKRTKQAKNLLKCVFLPEYAFLFPTKIKQKERVTGISVSFCFFTGTIGVSSIKDNKNSPHDTDTWRRIKPGKKKIPMTRLNFCQVRWFLANETSVSSGKSPLFRVTGTNRTGTFFIR